MRDTRETATNSTLATPPLKTSVGRATVERMLGHYQQSSRKVLLNLAAAVIGVIVIGGWGTSFYLNLTTSRNWATHYDSLGEQPKITRDMVKVL